MRGRGKKDREYRVEETVEGVLILRAWFLIMEEI
jgi:hypothetical protein